MDEQAIRRPALITPRRAMFAALPALLALKAIAEYERSIRIASITC
jgi:hypothetical protein